MNNIQVSIIIPVYNVERYIEKNIESLIALKNNNIEFIYIDDGSTDRSAEILNQYATNDNRMRVIHQKNAGLSMARNIGMESAEGKWILFVDGDDWVDSSLLPLLLKECDNTCDVICGSYSRVQENDTLQEDNKVIWVEREVKKGKDWLMQESVDYVACVYLYRTSFLKKWKIMFPKELLHEDMEFVPKVFSLAEKVKKTNICYYRYVQRPGSISQTKNIKRSKDLLTIAKHLQIFYEQHKISGISGYTKSYLAFLCETAIHLAVQANIDIKEVFDYDEKKRKIAIGYILQGRRFRDKFLAIFLIFHLDRTYARLYKFYDSRISKKGNM